MHVLRLFCASVLVAASVVSAQTKRPMTFADLQAMKRVSDPQNSPSGKWVLFSVTDVSLEKNTKVNHLWVVAITGGPERILSALPASDGRFSPDGKSVLFIEDDAEAGANVFVASWNDDKGEFGKARGVRTLSTGADGLLWAPDSKHFLFTSNVYPECESHALPRSERSQEEANCNAAKDAAAAKNPVKAMVFDHLLYRHWNAFVGSKHSHIFYASVEQGAPEDLTPASVIGDHEAPTFSLGGPMGYAISPDGREVAYVTNLDKVPAASTNNDIFVLQVGAEPGTAKKVSTSPGSDDGPAYSPDGKWLAWRSQKRNGFESDFFDLVLMDRSTGKITNPIGKGTNQKGEIVGDNWVDEFAWAPDSKRIAYASPDRGREIVKVIPIFTYPGSALAGWSATDGELGSLGFSNDGTVIATRMFVNRSNEIVAIKNTKTMEPGDDVVTGGTEITALTHLNDALESSLDLSKLEPFWFKGAADTDVEGFIVKPPNFDSAKKYPVKFLMHGGPQTQWGDAWSYRWNPELFAADGYVVVMVNRRGSTGYGQKFVDEVSGDWGGKAFVDLMKGLDYAEAHYSFIDKDRECALGASYGGFMANWVLTHTDRFKCIVTHDGMYNPQSAYGSTEEMWFNEWEFRPMAANGMVEQTKPAQPWDFYNATNESDPFRKWSPMLHIKDAHTPTLVVHSQRDYRLDVSEGFQLFTALQRLGVPSRMLYFPDEGHWVLKPQNSQLWYQTVDDWCDQWLGVGKYAAVGPEKNPMAKRVVAAHPSR